MAIATPTPDINTMIRKALLLACAAWLVTSLANAQQYRWVKGGDSSCSGSIYRLLDKITNIATDANRNVYIAIGDQTISANTFHLTQGYAGAHCYQQVLFASYNCNGQMRFAKFINRYEIAGHAI